MPVMGMAFAGARIGDRTTRSNSRMRVTIFMRCGLDQGRSEFPVQLGEPGAAGVRMVDPVALVRQVVDAEGGCPVARETPAQLGVGDGERADCAEGVDEVAVVERAVLSPRVTHPERSVPVGRKTPV